MFESDWIKWIENFIYWIIQKDGCYINEEFFFFNEIINDVTLTSDIKKDDILSINHIDGPYNENKKLKARIEKRGYEKSKVINLGTSINKIS